MSAPVIDITNLSKFYGKARGIEHINLEINEGEIFGFIGPNGAGKSTTIRILMNMIFPTSQWQREDNGDGCYQGNEDDQEPHRLYPFRCKFIFCHGRSGVPRLGMTMFFSSHSRLGGINSLSVTELVPFRAPSVKKQPGGLF